MSVVFGLTALLTLASALAAVMLRNLIHAALALAVTFAGVAAVYLQLGAEFLGFAQVLIYIGAVAILIVFAVLLTRGGEVPVGGVHASRWWVGALVALAVLATVGWATSSMALPRELQTTPPTLAVGRLGEALMGRWVVALQVLGVLLTAALIGAVLLAWRGGAGDGPKTGSEEHS
ncbi:MAG: NADH-quinone oxidoreductase subunit J [Limisphaera sp.]|nr:NADH-quinone oxidoreductase subunit J [Limisphaera sp.]